MHDIIKILVDADHYLRCPVDTIARDGEGDVIKLEITFPEKLSLYWVYLDFKMPNGEKFKSPRLDVEGNTATYTVPPYVLVEGKLKMQVLFKNADGATWKSYKKPFTVRPSINAVDDIPDKEDFIAEAQKLLDEIEKGGGGGADITQPQNWTEQQKATARDNIGVTEIVVDDHLDPTSTNPVQNKVVTEAINEAGGQAYAALNGMQQHETRLTAVEADVADLKENGGGTGGGGGGNITVDDALSETSTNPVQNKVVTEAINGINEQLKVDAGYTKLDGFYSASGSFSSSTVWHTAEYIVAGMVGKELQVSTYNDQYHAIVFFDKTKSAPPVATVIAPNNNASQKKDYTVTVPDGAYYMEVPCYTPDGSNNTHTVTGFTLADSVNAISNRMYGLENGSGNGITVDTELDVDSGNPIANSAVAGAVQELTERMDDLEENGGGGGSIAVDDALSTTSTNPAQNKVVTEAFNRIYGAGKNIIDPSKVIAAGDGSLSDQKGELVSGSTWVFGDYQLIEGETYTLSKVRGNLFLVFYNADGSYAGLSNRKLVTTNTFTFVAPTPILKIMAYADIATLDFQIELGDTATGFESFGYALKENMRVTDPNVVNNLLAPNNVTDKYVADGGIHSQKLNFTKATYNLVNPLACAAGYFSSKGSLVQSNGAVATDFIPVSVDDAYVRSNPSWYNCAFYDADKGFISLIEQGNIAPIPANASYVRVSYFTYLENAHKLCVYVGEEEKPFAPYRAIPLDYIEQEEDLFPKVSYVLTKDLYVADGVKVDINAQSITRGMDVDKMMRPIFAPASSGGAPYPVYGKHIEIAGGAVQDCALNVTCVPRWEPLVGNSPYLRKTINIHNVPANAGSGQTKKVLILGDSKTDANVYTQCLLDMFADDPMSIELLGTRGNTDTNRHEGRSAWSAKTFCLKTPDRGAHFGTSPFYNPAGDKDENFDFAYYMAQQGYDGVDYVFLNSGTNDEEAEFIGYYHTIIDSIREYDPNIVIGLWVPAPWATFGGYSHITNDNFTFGRMQKVIDEFDTDECKANKIYVIPTHMNINTEYDFGWEDVPYTETKPEHTYRVCTDQIHEVNGYYKNANVIFGYIKHFATLD